MKTPEKITLLNAKEDETHFPLPQKITFKLKSELLKVREEHIEKAQEIDDTYPDAEKMTPMEQHQKNTEIVANEHEFNWRYLETLISDPESNLKMIDFAAQDAELIEETVNSFRRRCRI